jgi:hypothetical protein
MDTKCIIDCPFKKEIPLIQNAIKTSFKNKTNCKDVTENEDCTILQQANVILKLKK